MDKIDKKSGMMYNMLIYNHTDRRGNYEMTIADSGIMGGRPDRDGSWRWSCITVTRTRTRG